MDNIWICKHDGSIQCEPGGGVSLEEMRKELAELIGGENILKMEQRSVTVIQVCGAPTGNLNAYLITEEGWRLLNDGIRGREDFNPCEGENIPIPIPQPVQIQELIGRPLRVYKTGEAITKDRRPNRVNIETDDQDVIVSIWFG
jgi:hypothetical protein